MLGNCPGHGQARIAGTLQISDVLFFQLQVDLRKSIAGYFGVSLVTNGRGRAKTDFHVLPCRFELMINSKKLG